MKIPGYTILRELGQGGMATVFLARQDRLDREVALKVMKPMAVAGSDFISRFIKEGQIIARLQHPNIVIIYDFDSADGLHYFSMEYLANGTLADLIKQGISPRRAAEITRKIAEALAVAHDRGIVHRDVKPQNILFRDDGTPVLTDFGIARATRSSAESMQLTGFGMVIGSPPYMSPEQSMGQPIDARSDLYSLGIVFYEMLTNEKPYQAEDPVSMAMKHCTAPIPIMPADLACYQDIIDRLLAKKPEYRFSSARQLIEALGNYGLAAQDAANKDDATRIVAPAEIPQAETAESALRTPVPTLLDSKAWVSSLSSHRVALIIAGTIAFAVVAGIGSLYIFVGQDSSDRLPHLFNLLPPERPGRSETAVRYERLVAEHIRKGELEQANDILRLGLAATSEDDRLNTLKRLLQDQKYADQRYDEARLSLDAGQINDSLKSIQEGLDRVPDHTNLKSLREMAQRREKELLTKELAGIEAKARELLEAGFTDLANNEIRVGLERMADHPGLLELQTRIRMAQMQRTQLVEMITQVRTYLAAGKPDQANAILERAMPLRPNDPELNELKKESSILSIQLAEQVRKNKLNKARSLIEGGELDASINLVEEGLRENPDDPEWRALNLKIESLKLERKADEAMVEAQKALVNKDLLGAIAALGAGLAIRPDRADLRSRYDELTRQLDEISRQKEERLLQEREMKALLANANQRLQVGDLEQAKALVSEGLDRESNNGELVDLAKKVEAAINIRDQVQLIFANAKKNMEDGNYTEALNIIDQGQDRISQDPNLKKMRKQIEEAQAEANVKKMQKAIANCNERFPSEQIQPGKLAAAGACYQSLLDQNPNDEILIAEMEKLRMLADRLLQEKLKSNDLVEANAALTDLKSLSPGSPKIAQAENIITNREKLMPDLVAIKGGCFKMGSPTSEKGREEDERQKKICLNDFQLGRYEVSVEDFERFVIASEYKTDAERGIGGTTGCWSQEKDKEDGYMEWASWRTSNKEQETKSKYPVSCVSVNDAVAYIDWLNKETGFSFRLPTEAEWEYAARAGTTSSRFWGDAIDHNACRFANVADSGSGWKEGFPCRDNNVWVAPIGSFDPNPWGLHDMLGNLWEWTCSEYHEGYQGAEGKCAVSTSDEPRILRGGAWNSGATLTRSAYRNRNYPEARFNFVGFRLAADN